MSVDYDLIILGSSIAGVEAAIAAAQLRARVALVHQEISVADSLAGRARVLQEAGRMVQQVRWAEQFGIWQTMGSIPDNWMAQTQQWATLASETLDALYSPAVLASLGIEMIAGEAEFCRKPKPGVIVNGRYLRSRAYLLAPICHPVIPKINGLETIDYLTPATVLQRVQALNPASSLVVIGTDPSGLELAQTFARLGSDVTVIASGATLLPSHDGEVARLLQAQLEADGVQILTHTLVTQVKQIQPQKWVQAGNQAIAADEILLAVGWKPDVSKLNLEAVGVDLNDQEIILNQKLQTTNPTVYACPGLVERAYLPHIAVAQARVAVKNALFLPLAKFTDRNLPHSIYTDPEIAHIGLTENQAIEQYGAQVLVLKQSFKSLASAQIQGNLTGFCKIIVRHNGEILGAQIVGTHASEIVGAIALAMQQHLKIQALANLTFPSLTVAEIIHQTAREWYRLRLEQKPGRQDFLEGFFNWRRSRVL